MSIEHKVEEYDVVSKDPHGGFEHREKVVENIGAVRRQVVQRVKNFIWFLFSVIEVLIGLRFFLKLIAANPASLFAQWIYNLTAPFMSPFASLTNSPAMGGMVLEISALIAMIVYAFIAWGLVSLVGILFNRSSERSVMVYESRRE